MITINYLHHLRSLEYWKITSHFLNKIKDQNKQKIRLNILASTEFDWKKDLDPNIQVSVHVVPPHENNYMKKIDIAVNQDTKYSIKLDEDCFINNYIFDYIIENISVLDDDDNFILVPILSNNIPMTERFINGFVDREVANKIKKCFLKQEMPNGLWGADYSPLNSCTIGSLTWDSEKFFNCVSSLNTHLKGIHPIRICAEAHQILNDYILKNLNALNSKNDYSIEQFFEPYYTTSTFVIKTQDWRNLLSIKSYDSYDEIQLNIYRQQNNKKFLYVKNGYAIHTFYNTMYGNKNIWNIGMENGQEYENEFTSLIVKEMGL